MEHENFEEYEDIKKWAKIGEDLKLLSDIPEIIGFSKSPLDVELCEINPILERYHDKYNLNMEPDFQRGHVWNIKQQIAFCEFIMRGGKTQPILLNHPCWGNLTTGYEKYEMICVDGLQRVTALQKMINGEIPIFGKFLTEFQDYKRHLRSKHIQIVVNNLESKKDVLQWYIELNSAGTQHTKAELNRVLKLLKKEIK